MTSSADNTRDLPGRRNPMLKNAPQYSELVDNRRLGQTNLGEKGHNGGPFSYVHLRIALPQPLEEQELFGTGSPESYFLMRRSYDGFVSSTGMFKASFPWAKKVEEEVEKQFVKNYFKNTSREETAGNLWVHPTDALALADDYGIRPWIEALLDNDTVLPSDNRKRNITPPPPFFGAIDSDAGLVASSAPPSSGIQRRSTRSMSPSKRLVTPRKSRASKIKDSPLKKELPPSINNENISTSSNIIPENSLMSTPVSNGNSPTTPTKKEPMMKFEVDEAVEKSAGVEVKTTHVKVELPDGCVGQTPTPESTAQMIAKAREMVAEAKKLEEPAPVSKKRKAKEVDDNSATDTGIQQDDKKLKKTKFLEDELRREKVKSRALLGLSATLAIGALLPYVL